METGSTQRRVKTMRMTLSGAYDGGAASWRPHKIVGFGMVYL
jgi:hypothetical protein